MEKAMEYTKARDLLVGLAKTVETEKVPLSQSTGRILAGDLCARENVPSFDRSPLDGYAIRAEDSENASPENPVTLKILEEVPAGYVPTRALTLGTATKILTGSPIPEGADAVVRFEDTKFTKETVTIFGRSKHGENVIYAGEDVKKGALLAKRGDKIDDGTAAALSAQDVMRPEVYGRPRVAIISTGTELLEEDEPAAPGMIRNTSRYAVTNALERTGCEVTYLGTAKDRVEKITEYILEGIKEYDMIILTGGVSVGDYDLTPSAMTAAGVDILVSGVALKPGMKCALGTMNGKPVCALSGNPASALAVYFAVVQPVVRKLAGFRNAVPQEFDIEVENGFDKPSRGTRLLRGRLKFADGKVKMVIPDGGQGNVMISGTAGCDVAAIVPAGTGPLEPGTVLKAFLT